MDFRASYRTGLTAFLAAACIGGFGLYALYFAHAAAPSCSNPEAISTVIDIEKHQLQTVPLYGLFDFERTEFSLENVRSEKSDGNKIACAATLVGDPKPKFLGEATEKNDAVVRQMFSAPFKAGIALNYTVQYTDDGKLYVELERTQ